VSELIVSQSVR